MSKIKVNSIEAATGTTITIPSGQTLDISSTTLTLPSTVVTTTGSQTLTNTTGLPLTSGVTGTLPTANGGTGLTSLGTSLQVLRVNTGATALEYGTVSGGLIKVSTFVDSTRRTLSDTPDSGAIFSFTYTKVQNATSSKLVIIGIVPGFGQNSNVCGIYFDCLTSGITSHNTNDSFAFHGVQYGCANSAAETDNLLINKTYEDASNLGSGNHTFEWGWRSRNGGNQKPYVVVNYNNSDDARQHQSASVFQVFEVTI